MPGYVIHLAIGRENANNNGIKNEEEFLRGIITPDLLDKKESHYGESSSKPDLQKFSESNSLENEYNQGYLLHLITDYLFYNKYLKGFSEELYHDYNKLNEYLIKKYNVELPSEITSEVGFEDGEPKILNRDSICKFIDTISKINIREINCLKKYWGKDEIKTKETK